MKKHDVIILTDKRYINPKVINNYIQNVLDEDNYVKVALENQGLKVARLSWDDQNFDWSTTHYVLFRTTWDYFDRFLEFSKWLNTISKQTTLLNSEKIIRWNIDKHYLQDLQQNGVYICESYFIEKGTQTTLKEISKNYNLTEFVLKPCISGAARHTYKIHLESIIEYEAIFSKLIINEAMIIQPFQYNIVEKGEISLMVINGKFTHSVLKKAKSGDFRVQDDFGGSVHNYTPTKEEIMFAENVVKACVEPPIYARVDVFTDNNGKLAIAELELIEPELWFRNCPAAADKLAKGIKQLISK
ncbi:RimK-like ATP-grasp domain-containing protein [Tenacibaculum sediminilitoris]|uniref:ATP-grasp domain-containing protein n=1 Tax=Tenacibaculum sediminilitoris TaxID=1820334 RepID=UPI0038932F71